MSEFNPSPDFEEKVRKAMAVSEPSPAFINRLHADLLALPVKRQNRLMFSPVWAIAVAVVIVVILSAPTVVTAFERLFGYVPDVGLVENTGNLRLLSEPVSITRDGVTLTITNVYVYEDHVEVVYDVSGITPSNDGWQASDAQENPTAFCGGVEIGAPMNKDGEARLKLPDGTMLERDCTGQFPQNVFAMKPVYQASVPADVNRMTLVLKCIPQARLGAVPENWEVPFDLKTVPASEVVGEPVIKVESTPILPTALPGLVATKESKVPVPIVMMQLKKIVPGSEGYVFFFFPWTLRTRIQA
jgi:hypothetical protein